MRDWRLAARSPVVDKEGHAEDDIESTRDVTVADVDTFDEVDHLVVADPARGDASRRGERRQDGNFADTMTTLPLVDASRWPSKGEGETPLPVTLLPRYIYITDAAM